MLIQNIAARYALSGYLLDTAALGARDIGIRMALGTGRSRLVRDVLVDGRRPAAAGKAQGAVGAFAPTRLRASWL